MKGVGMSEHDEQQSGSGLRKQLEEALERIKSLESENQSFRQEKRATSLQSALRQAGKDPRAASLLPSDLDPDGVSDWLKENGDLIANLPKAEEPAPPAPKEEAPRSADDEALRQVTSAEPTSGDPGDALTQLSQVKTKDELNAFLQKNGMQGSIL